MHMAKMNRLYTRKSDKVQKRNESHSDIQETGNFEAVVKCIEDKIIGPTWASHRGHQIQE